MKGYTPGLDLVAISISVFFILYTMSSVGRSLASRAELDTRWKLSKELAATFTFFLASGFMFVDAMFSVILGVANPSLMGGIGDAIKLLVFPFVAFIMELNFLRKSRKVLKPAEVPEEIPMEREEPQEESKQEEEPEQELVEEEEKPSYTEDEEEETPESEDSDDIEEEESSEEDSEWE